MTAYALWEKPDLPRLPRSRLYSLEPHGLGTPHVESLTSYLRRLAAAHSVTVSKLVKKEIVLLCRPGRAKNNLLDTNSRRLHSGRELVLEVTWALQCLTGRPHLPFLTFVPWMDVAVFDEVLRPSRAWCVACLEEQRQAGLDITEPLLWALQPLEICPK